jgi:hypothetical protein
MTLKGSQHEYDVHLTEADRLEVLDQLELAEYYIKDLANESVAERLKTNAKLREFFGKIWRTS